MLRIDLLPAYVAQRRLTNQLVVIFTIMLGVIVFVMLGFGLTIQQPIKDMSAKADAAEKFKADADGFDQKTTAEQALEPPYQTKLTFVKSVEAHNLAYQKIYRSVAAYTIPTILYNSMSISGTSLSISAYTPSLADLSNYLAHIWNNPYLASVSTSAFPGYKEEYDPSSVDYTLPVLPPGYVPLFKHSTIPVKSFKVVGGQIVSISSGNEPASTTQPTTNQKKPLFDPLHSGFDFSVSAVLKAAIPEPVDPTSSGGSAGAAGGPPRPPGA